MNTYTVTILGRTRDTDYLVATDGTLTYFLTDCCQASAKGVEGGIACRACYEYIDPGLGGIYDERFDGPILPLDIERDGV